MEELRQFMFESVYRNPRAKGEEGKAQDVILRLFEHYDANPDELPDEYQYIREREGTTRAVADYIAGMTDSYAVNQFSQLFLPRAWQVK
jgi:dGTPase